MRNFFLFLTLLFLLTSCFSKKSTNTEVDTIELKQDTLHLIFSHNINGETHPCGCRHFPLGGLPQVAGKLSELKSSGDVILLDTGDMLFPSPNLPATMRQSFTFGAKNLSKGMSQLGLKYFVPGDQDLALGINFLKNLLKDSSYQLLITNLNDPKTVPHKRFVILEKGDHKIFLFGLVDPDVFQSDKAKLFESPSSVMPKIMLDLKKIGFDNKNLKHRLVLLSHAGMPNDQKLVKAFKDIDWVLGAHTQNFTKNTYQEGQTQLAQVLSRNHYLGEVRISLEKDKKNDKWLLHEIRDKLEEALSPNPFISFIKDHKDKLRKLQIEEQSSIESDSSQGVTKISTAQSCMECHQKQVDFWSETPHSIAYATLINHNEDKNLNCISCHSVGFKDPNGFEKASDLIHFDKESYPDEKKLDAVKTKYWKEVTQAFKNVGSIRELPKNKVKVLSKAWLKKDEKFKVTHNFANVQCMNCHDLHLDHPFAIPAERSAVAKIQGIQEKCLNCHDPDQSPEWYEVLENGKHGRAKDDLVKQKIKMLSCPKREEE